MVVSRDEELRFRRHVTQKMIPLREPGEKIVAREKVGIDLPPQRLARPA
jgi:hypothetical protein